MIRAKKSVENMNGYYVPMYEKNWDIKLDGNENNYGPSPKVIEALRNLSLKSISFYPFYGELSQKIADYYGFGINNIKVTNGADEAIQGIIQTYMEDGDSLLTLDVSFEMPVIYSLIQNGNVIKVPYKTKWEFPVNDFTANLHNPSVKIVYIASPNNPTGSLISEDAMQEILNNSKDKVIIIDETYANYAGVSYKEFAKLYDNVFIVRSFSKDFALAGMRLGCVISNEANINNLKKVISPFSVNSFAMTAGIAALEDCAYFDKIREEVLDSKKELTMFFESLGAIVYKSHANFLLIDFKEKAEFIYEKLREANIAVKLFKKNSLLENHLRITIPQKSGVEKIKNVLKLKPALVFDMDGVLIDASKSYRMAIKKTYETFSPKKISFQEIQEAKNSGGLNNDWDLTEYLLKKDGISVSYRELTDVFQNFYWNDGCGLINDEEILFNKELFKTLSKDYNLSIFTGRLKKEAKYALERFEVENLFFPIITTDDIPPNTGKPNPCGLNIIKEKLPASKYYYFGDTQDDMLAAKAAGYTPIGVLPPQDKSQNLINILTLKGAEHVLQSINDITTIAEQKNEAMC